MAVSLFLEGHEIGKHIALFLRGTKAAHHIIAIAPEPLLDFGRVRESIGVGRRSHRQDVLAGCCMLAVLLWRRAMTTCAGHVAGGHAVPVWRVEPGAHNFPSRLSLYERS